MSVDVQEQYGSPTLSQGRQTRSYVALTDAASDDYASVVAAVQEQEPQTLDGLKRLKPIRQLHL